MVVICFGYEGKKKRAFNTEWKTVFKIANSIIRKSCVWQYSPKTSVKGFFCRTLEVVIEESN